MENLGYLKSAIRKTEVDRVISAINANIGKLFSSQFRNVVFNISKPMVL
jgi:hypothetical protein